MQSTDFGSIVSPLGAGYRRRFATGGYNGDIFDRGPPAPSAPAPPAAPTGTVTTPGGYLPTVGTTLSDNGVSPTYGKIGSTLLGIAAPPLGLALTGYNTLAQINNTAQNASMLGSMGDPLGIGQMIGGALGLNGYGGSATGALNAAMNTNAGRAALSTPQAGGELPGVSMPTQTAPLAPVSSQPLSGNQVSMGGNGGGGGGGNAHGFGAAGQGTAVGVGSSPSGPGGMGGMAHGGRVGRRDRAPHVVVVVPHMGALMLAGMRR